MFKRLFYSTRYRVTWIGLLMGSASPAWRRQRRRAPAEVNIQKDAQVPAWSK